MTRGRRGQALVETALTFPILIVLLMGIIDVGFVLYAHVQVAAAAREGARAGVAFPGDVGAVQSVNDQGRLDVIKNAIYNPDDGSTTMGFLKVTTPSAFDINSDVLVSYPDATTSATRRGDKLKVTVTYRQLLFFDLLPGIDTDDRLQVASSVEMRIQ